METTKKDWDSKQEINIKKVSNKEINIKEEYGRNRYQNV